MQNKNGDVKNNFLNIDNATKIISSIITVGGFIWGIITFQTEQRVNETLEFRRKLWEKRLDTYNKLSEITGKLIVYRNNEQAFDSLQERFDFLYYSSMVMVEDTLVEDRMISFSNAIKDYKEKRKTEIHLKFKAIELMKEMSKSLKKKQELLFYEE